MCRASLGTSRAGDSDPWPRHPRCKLCTDVLPPEGVWCGLGTEQARAAGDRRDSLAILQGLFEQGDNFGVDGSVVSDGPSLTRSCRASSMRTVMIFMLAVYHGSDVTESSR